LKLEEDGPLAKSDNTQSHAEWWSSSAETAMAAGEQDVLEQSVVGPYTEAQAAGSLNRAIRLVGVLSILVTGVALWRGGWKAAGMAAVGTAISASGLWEWRRLMTTLLTQMTVQDAVSAGRPDFSEATAMKRRGGKAQDVPAKKPVIGFVAATFTVRLVVVVAIVYVSLSYLHGSVLALVAGLALGVVALTVEGIWLLRSGTI